MEITSFTVEGYRSLADITIDQFGRTTILAGRNSAGKSNIIRALNMAFDPNGKPSQIGPLDFHPNAEEISIDLELLLSPLEYSEICDVLRSEDHEMSQSLRDFLGGPRYNCNYRVSFFKNNPSRRTWYFGYKKLTNYHPLFAKGASKPSNRAALRAFRNILLRSYRTMTLRDSFASLDTATEQEIIQKIHLQSANTDLVEKARYNEIRDDLLFITEGIGGDIQTAQLSLEANSEEAGQTLELRSEVERSYSLPFAQMGDGAQRVALVLYYLINSDESIIALEEPEASLHPGAQRRFRNTIDRLRLKYQKQLLITTHSDIFLEGWQAGRLFEVDIAKGNTLITEAVGRDRAAAVADGLGVRAGYLQSAAGIIWVEGPSDIMIYRSILETVGVDLDASNVTLMFGGGDSMQHITASDLKRLNKNFVILMDSDRTSEKKNLPKWKRELAAGCKEEGAFFFATQRREIENYFPVLRVAEYYKQPGLPNCDHYEDFSAFVKKNISGRSYVKTRDAGPISKTISVGEIEGLGDLTQALDEIKTRISQWKG